jgi:putative ABC transport system permease protein
MTPTDTLLFSFRALWGHRLRTLLSLGGMSIGVAAVVLLTALGEGARLYVIEQFAGLGGNLIVALPGRNETTGAFPGLAGVPNDLTLQDAEALLRGVPEIARVSPMVAATDSIGYRERRRDVAVLGTSHSMMEVMGLKLGRGRFLPSGDLRQGGSEAVLGFKTARELFKEEDPLGKTIRIGESRARVVGVMAESGLQVGVDINDIVLIPVATAMRIFNRSSLLRLMAQTHAYEDLSRAEKQMRAILLERHGEEDFSILTQDSVISALSTILTVLTAAVAAIAAISLSVAGVGIMNVMLVSVSERTSEVGLLKAIGAARGQILRIFLTEAALLSLAGTAVGLFFGYVGARLVVAAFPTFPAQPPLWATGAAIAVALVFGVLFGILPARRATRLEPVAALARR